MNSQLINREKFAIRRSFEEKLLKWNSVINNDFMYNSFVYSETQLHLFHYNCEHTKCD